MNQEQIKNPHRIYPGDVHRARPLGARSAPAPGAAGDRQARSPQVRVEPLDRRSDADHPALRHRAVPVEAAGRRRRPSSTRRRGSVATAGRPGRSRRRQHRLRRGPDPGQGPSAGRFSGAATRWSIPETKEMLGYEAIYLGEARAAEFARGEHDRDHQVGAGDLRGDRLLPAAREVPIFGYVPHAPQKAVRGRIVSTYGGLGEAGPLSIVTLSKGARDGLEVGHVLALYRSQSARATSCAPRRCAAAQGRPAAIAASATTAATSRRAIARSTSAATGPLPTPDRQAARRALRPRDGVPHVRPRVVRPRHAGEPPGRGHRHRHQPLSRARSRAQRARRRAPALRRSDSRPSLSHAARRGPGGMAQAEPRRRA